MIKTSILAPLSFGVLLLVAFPSCATLKYNEINTGVLLDVEEIVILDRNIGAKTQNASGKYLTWKKAMASCPKGYHLLTYDEAIAMAYKTPAELIHSDIAMRPYGLVVHGKGLVGDQEFGYYHLADIFDKNESWYLYLNENESSKVFGINYKRRHKDRMSVRCVKDFTIDGGSQSVKSDY